MRLPQLPIISNFSGYAMSRCPNGPLMIQRSRALASAGVLCRYRTRVAGSPSILPSLYYISEAEFRLTPFIGSADLIQEIVRDRDRLDHLLSQSSVCFVS